MVARSPIPRVLIVDAEFYICRVLEAKLSKDNRFVTVTATSGPDALHAALEQSFDVILWDMRLRDTFTMLPRLRALSPLGVLFLMTTDDRPSMSVEVRRLDAAGVLVKPFGLDNLVGRIQASLDVPPTASAAASVDLSRIGQLMTITSPKGRCLTRVLERGLDTFSVVSAPRVDTPPDFSVGQRVRVQVKGEDALYSFQSRLVRSEDEPVPHWELNLPRIIRREQRRKHPRLPLHLPVLLSRRAESLADTPESPESGEPGTLKGLVPSGITEDVGLGGFALVGDHTFPVGQAVRFAIQHAAIRDLDGLGTIVRAESVPAADPVPESGAARYRLALQFTDVPPVFRRRLRALLVPRP